MQAGLLDQLQTPVATLDRQGRVTAANRAFRELVAADSEGIGLETLFEYLTWADFTWDDILARCAEGPYRCTLSRGGRLFETTLSETADGLLAEFALHTEDDLPDVDQTRRLLAALEQASDVIVVTDPDARIRYVNPAFERVMGYRREEVLGRHNRIWRSGAHDDAFYAEAWERIQQGELWRGELINKRRDGSLVYEDTSISRVTDARGEVLGYVTVKRDVTTQRELEQTLARAQRMESIGTLAGGVAHDFNNVLQTILGNAELLLELGDAEPRLLPFATQIRDAAEHSAALTAQLLAFARKQVITPRAVDTNLEIERALELMRRLIGASIELRWAPGEAVWPLRVDPSQLGQIVTNICINARDAIDGTGSIEVGTANLEAAACADLPIPPEAQGDYVCIRIRDDGVGMDAETLARIFEPFYTTKGPGEGTGLGLSSVYGIVVQNGGHVFAESTPGMGTTLSVYLPRHEGPVETRASSDTPSQAPARPARVLVVEDEAPILELMRLVLEQAGYEVLACPDPRQALASASEAGPLDLVISDVIMPGMNGHDLVDALREDRPSLPALFVSGYTAEALADLSEEDPGSDFLQKPFQRTALLERVQALLEG
ncbi:MAG: PAS domain S-box protein [Pseudomonadales bacterium]|jgi:PAS domain S-box-containing protein|nr:PAS domain S-box protein [Pseudomonadales bacterium]